MKSRRPPVIYVKLRRQKPTPAMRASVKAVIEEVVAQRSPSIRAALIDGIESGPRNADRYVRLCAEYTDGKPDANLHLRTTFKEDEMASAQRSLQRKMELLFEKARGTVAVLVPGE